MNSHESMLESVAVYALGSLSPQEAQAVRSHLKTCEECRREYRDLAPAAEALGYSAEACEDARSGAIAPPSPLLKKRIMAQIRPNVGEIRAVRPIVWPAYAVAAACVVLALVTSIFNISLNEEIHASQSTIAQLNANKTQLARQLAIQRLEMADLVAPDSQRYPVENGQVVKHGSRIYIAMDALPAPPKGKVYQAWTLHAGATQMSPSVTFVPNSGGVAVVPLPGNGSAVVAVAVSVEPDGGSKQPTSKPTFVLKFT
ncbi:MAG TPA: anti-sigma factor [Candidatus Baltobacteraceae bacterium]|jgi:anti-sigma-K factor RskA|nr:anti-sigma factor [Candidatus Baltobacteraceae bacterium]